MLDIVMADFILDFADVWDFGDTIFLVFLGLSVLTMLYTMQLIYNKIRLIESELQSMRKDQSVISDELELVAKTKNEKRGGSPPQA